MRLRTITLVYSIMVIAVICVGVFLYKNDTHVDVNMTDIHKSSVEIQKEYLSGKDVSAIEKEYDCSVIFETSRSYEEELWQAIGNGSIVLDLRDDSEMIIGKMIFSEQEAAYSRDRIRLWIVVAVVCGTVILMGYVLLIYAGQNIVKPFAKMQKFAGEVAKGNLDFKLPMIKNNYFGAFTESFDILREELKKAREQEYLANQSKKELVAELSHDIKTPLSTISANCELISVTSSDAAVLKRVDVISGKTQTIEQLVDNLFHATLEELTVLKVEPVEESTTVITDMIDNMSSYGEIEVANEIPGCLVWMDKLRFNQVIDNILYNSYKYAGTAIQITYEDKADGIVIRIADSGPGVSDEELPLITEKFFRGKNSSGKQGSGLGLFLAKNFMGEMRGDMTCYNRDGFVVELFLRKV